MKKVLCVSSGACRALMMATLLRIELGDEFEIASARTTSPSQPPNNERMQGFLRELGGPKQESPWLGTIPLSQFTHIVCADERARRHVQGIIALHLDTQVIGVDIPDPRQETLQAYRECFRRVMEIIPELAKKIRDEE